MAITTALPKPVGKELISPIGLEGASREQLEALEACIPKQLLLLTAILIAHGIVLIEDIWPHLGPNTEEGLAPGELDEVENLVNRQIKFAQ